MHNTCTSAHLSYIAICKSSNPKKGLFLLIRFCSVWGQKFMYTKTMHASTRIDSEAFCNQTVNAKCQEVVVTMLKNYPL